MSVPPRGATGNRSLRAKPITDIRLQATDPCDRPVYEDPCHITWCMTVQDRNRSIVTDAKIVPYETVAPQHRPLVCTFKITPPRVQQVERCGAARVKLWRMKEKDAASELGITKPGRWKVDKQTWLWTDDVKAKVREKKSPYRVFLSDKTAENWQKYQKAKKDAKKAVAVAKATHYSDVNEKLAARDGERYLYRLAKTRHRQTEDIEKFFGINDGSGHLLTDRKNALKRWRDYFEEISTMEFLHPAIPSVDSVHGPFTRSPWRKLKRL
ncbi:unnamed protein product [Heligmosomoides polygyrus]|uniref:DUF4550 domain-containing protein n=1 Tax=Heligmosomoides polygyrus TaxID=6339 RepID=A0A183FYX2_HELPZ|nr:unnamed protein product [Heligmosomoides polygyrus]